jgi:hypothetical protein
MMPVDEVEKVELYYGRNTIKPRIDHLYTSLQKSVLTPAFSSIVIGYSLRRPIGFDRGTELKDLMIKVHARRG